MTEKEINLKSVLFLIIGILLLLSLVICIYIVNGERDLVSVEANVIDVKKDENGTGKNDITVSYDIAGTSYNYNFYYKDNVNINDKITLYYHEKNVNTVTTFKTNKLIFVFPILGLFLCILSLFELFKHSKVEEEIFKTSVIDVSGTLQKLEIVTDDTIVKEYHGLPEERVEAEVKAIKKRDKNAGKKFKLNKQKDAQSANSSVPKDQNEDWYIEVKDDVPNPDEKNVEFSRTEQKSTNISSKESPTLNNQDESSRNHLNENKNSQ